MLKRETLINPTHEEVERLRICLELAEEHYYSLCGAMFDREELPFFRKQFNTLYGLYKSNKMSRALGYIETLFENAKLEIPDELRLFNEQARRFYIVEFLILWGDEIG